MEEEDEPYLVQIDTLLPLFQKRIKCEIIHEFAESKQIFSYECFVEIHTAPFPFF